MHRQLTRAIKIVWVRILTPPLQAQGLFHRHFSKHKYAYDALGLLPGNSQGEEKEVSKKGGMFTLSKDRGLKEPHGVFQNTGHKLIHHIASHIYGQEHGSGNNINASLVNVVMRAMERKRESEQWVKTRGKREVSMVIRWNKWDDSKSLFSVMMTRLNKPQVHPLWHLTTCRTVKTSPESGLLVTLKKIWLWNIPREKAHKSGDMYLCFSRHSDHLDLLHLKKTALG